MTYKIFSTLTKVVITLILIYSVFMILFMLIFDLLSMSTSVSFTTFFIEKMIPNISAVIALIFLIRYLWFTDKNSNTSKKRFHRKKQSLTMMDGHKDNIVGERKVL